MAKEVSGLGVSVHQSSTDVFVFVSLCFHMPSKGFGYRVLGRNSPPPPSMLLGHCSLDVVPLLNYNLFPRGRQTRMFLLDKTIPSFYEQIVSLF